MKRHHRPARIAFLASLAIVSTACGASGSDTGDSGTAEIVPSATDPNAPQDTAGVIVTPTDTEVAAPAGDAGGFTADDNGTGLVRVDGVEYPDFVGDCFVHRGLDPETYAPVPVGDLATPGLSVVVGIDNVASGPAVEANFIMVGESNFRMAGVGGAGTIDSISYLGPPTSFGSVDLARVAFSGATDEGSQVVAEVVCEVGLG